MPGDRLAEFRRRPRVQVAGHVAGGDAPAAQRADGQVRQVLADALAGGKGLGGAGAVMRGVGDVDDVSGDRLQQMVQPVQVLPVVQPVGERIDLQLSARYEDYGGTVGSTFDPQARVRIELTDWLALRGGAGTTFRGPPPQNLYADLVILTFIGGAFRAVDILANPDLAPESATTWNLGVLLDRGGLRASADYGQYDFEGPIEVIHNFFEPQPPAAWTPFRRMVPLPEIVQTASALSTICVAGGTIVPSGDAPPGAGPLKPDPRADSILPSSTGSLPGAGF